MRMTKAAGDILYIMNKISYLRENGLVTGNHDGRGINGGACPTWLHDLREKERKERKRYAKAKTYITE